MKEDLRQRVINIKITEGISYRKIMDKIGFTDESFFSRWKQSKKGFILPADISIRLDEFLESKGY